MDKKLFDELKESFNQALEHTGGKRELKTTTLMRPIDSPEEYSRAETVFNNLIDKENRSPEEDKLFDLLTNLLEDYEKRTLPPLEK